jgi:hypothetical protein
MPGESSAAEKPTEKADAISVALPVMHASKMFTSETHTRLQPVCASANASDARGRIASDALAKRAESLSTTSADATAVGTPMSFHHQFSFWRSVEIHHDNARTAVARTDAFPWNDEYGDAYAEASIRTRKRWTDAFHLQRNAFARPLSSPRLPSHSITSTSRTKTCLAGRCTVRQPRYRSGAVQARGKKPQRRLQLLRGLERDQRAPSAALQPHLPAPLPRLRRKGRELRDPRSPLLPLLAPQKRCPQQCREHTAKELALESVANAELQPRSP